MNDEQIIDLLRAANPVPHHRDAIRVVRETDPLWQSIQVLLREGSEGGEVRPFPQRQGREPMSEHDIATPHRRSQRWLPAAAVLAVVVAAVAAVIAIQMRPTEVAGIPTDLDLPGRVLSPTDAARILGIDEYATVNPDAGPGLAPGDCTTLGAVEVVDDSGYLATTADRGLWGTRVFEFASTDTATAMIQTIKDDIQDCDRAEHPLFEADLVSIEDVQAVGATAFVMTTEDRGERDCWVFVQQGPSIATALVGPGYYGDGVVCTELARAMGDVLPTE